MSFKKLLGFNEMPNLEKQYTKYDDYYMIKSYCYNHPERSFAIIFTSSIVIFSIIMIIIGISLTLNLEGIV